MKDNKRILGSKKENLALEYMSKQGFRILDMNYRNRFGEIDIVGMDGDALVFTEVKYRSNQKYGNPSEAVNYYKQRQIIKIAKFYTMHKKISHETNIRFDVVAILGDDITWYKSAFTL